MTTATSSRVNTEFLVTQDTTSKELFEQLKNLSPGKGGDQPAPIRAYKKIGSKGTTLKIYNKKHTLGREIKAAANPQRVSARVLVIKTIEKILVAESKKSTSPDDKQIIDQVLGNIKKRKSHCERHDIKIPDLIDDLQKLMPVWEKSSVNDQQILTSSPAALQPSKKIDPPKESPAEKIASIKITKKSKSQSNNETSSTHKKNRSAVQSAEKPNLKIKRDEFDLSKAIEFLNKVKNFGSKFSSASNAKARIRAGEIKDTGELSFYISTKANSKAKKTTRRAEGRKAEDKNISTSRAITVLRAIADSLVKQKRLDVDEVNKIFSAIEKQGFISVNDASVLLDLLETGRRAVYEQTPVVQTDSQDSSTTSAIISINTNPFDETPIQESTQMKPSQSLNDSNTNPFDNMNVQKNTNTIKPISATTANTNPFEIEHIRNSTNPFEDMSIQKAKSASPVTPSFFQQVADFFKPVTNFFASVRRFLGFN